MEATGIALAVIAETRTIVQSLVTRIANYRTGPKTFRGLSDRLIYVTEQMEELDRLLRKFPNAIPVEGASMFNGTLEHVRQTLQGSEDVMQNELLTAFAKSSSGLKQKIKSKVQRTIRANALHDKMADVEGQIKYASDHFLHLHSMLTFGLKHDESREVNAGAATNADKSVAASALGVPGTIIIKADATDANGGVQNQEEFVDHNLKWLPLQRGEPGPLNMVEGGHRSGRSEKLYVARGITMDELTPGKFEGTRRRFYASWGGREWDLDDFEVLTYKGSEPLIWVSAANGDVPNGAVAGGKSKYDKTIFIGRVEQDDELVCGKVVPRLKCLYIPYSGRELVKQEYEVLVAPLRS